MAGSFHIVSRAIVLAIGTAFCGLSSHALAGGGGQNMVLLVNPNDEASLRIANAYVAARAIPERNIVFIAPTQGAGFSMRSVTAAAFTTNYLNQLPGIIQARGLANQADYIGTIGQPHSVWSVTGASSTLSFNNFLGQMTQFQRGLAYDAVEYRTSELFQVQPSYETSTSTPVPLPYARGSNTAIHHTTQYALKGTGPTGYTYAQWYMSGNIGNSGTFSITTQQVIDSFARSAAADGTKPDGTVYFVETDDDLRTGTRKPYWPAVQRYMTANGMKWQQPHQPYVGAPTNAPDVRGAIVGAANYALPNGSTYLPGSYADSLTSSGGSYGGSGQTKADKFIRAGAVATAGAITEPYANANRFTQSTFYIYHGEGSTIGESYYKSVKTPEVLMLQGDMLSQAYADVPNVAFTAAPANGATVAGTVTVGASASLVNPSIATGIAKLQLFVDGVDKGSIAAASGSFNLDTTSLSDGRHEVRVVAVNNSQAESQGYKLLDLQVNNKGQTAAATGSAYTAAWNQTVSVPVAATIGTGGVAVTRVELRSLGRVVGQVGGAAGSIGVSAQSLAYGDNTIVPVAVMADGSEVRGTPLVITRNFNKLAGASATPAAQRIAGLDFEYFANAAGSSLAGTNFSVPATDTAHGTILSIDPNNATVANRNLPAAYMSGNNAGLAVRVKGRFEVATEGEYSFFFETGANASFEAVQMSIDGQILSGFDLWTGSAYLSKGTTRNADTLRTFYLLPGEHDLTLLLNNPVANTDAELENVWWYRGPSGDTFAIDATNFYTVVPEPAAIGLLAAVGLAALARRPGRNDAANAADADAPGKRGG